MEETNAAFRCEWCSTIEIIWANYGVQVLRKYPLAISTRNKDCVATNATSVMENKCNGKTQCSFPVQSREFLKKTCGQNTILLVRYTCKPIPGNKGEFRFCPIGAFVYVFALDQSDCVNFQLLPENTNISTEI